MQHRFFALRLGAILLIMLDTLRRSFLHHDAFDRTMLVIELLVLSIIALEGLLHIGRHFKVRHRSRRLYKCFFEGQTLQNRVPPPSVESLKQAGLSVVAPDDWLQQVHKWSDSTNRLVRRYSPDASVMFLHSRGINFGVVEWDRIHQSAKAAYSELYQQLNNLRAIIEKPDVF
jgi:hypothetical protein